MTMRRRMTAGFLFGLGGMVISGFGGSAMAGNLAASDPLKAISIYAEVLPAISCHRLSKEPYTTDDRAMNRLLDAAMAHLGDDEVADMKKAIAKGAARHDAMVAKSGEAGYCKAMVKAYGPKGSVVPGLLKRR